MSKSYGNTIPLMADPDVVAPAGSGGSSPTPRRPTSPRTRTPARSSRSCACSPTPPTIAEVETRYRVGGIGYGEAKTLLAEVVEEHVAPLRRRYARLRADPDVLQERFIEGERHAARRADEVLARAMTAMGL